MEKEIYKKKATPIYLRWWLYLPFAFMALSFLGMIAAFTYLKMQYAPIVDAFDLSKLTQMEAASVVYDRSGQAIGSLFIENRVIVPYSEISPLLTKSVVAEEDNRFYQHSGVDFWGIARAAFANYRLGRTVQGGSTVTQQLARNSFDLKERTYRRKITEIFLARRIETVLSKDQIMELYLNRVYFGSGFFGAEAAARGYFGKSASSLNASECALLAGLLKSPQGLSPWKNPEGALKTRNRVLKRMYEMGFISANTLAESLKKPLGVKPRTNPAKVNYALDLVRQQAILALGFDRVMNEGFHIYTTLDLNMQHTAELVMHNQLTDVEKMPLFPREYQTYQQYADDNAPIEDMINRGNMSVKLPTPKYLQGSVLMVDNSSGAILVMVGGRNFYHSEYNRTIQARREIGTAFTPLVYLAAYNQGVFPGEIVEDTCLDNRYVMVGGAEGILGEWGVERRENRYEGPLTTHYALAQGKNAATVRLGLRVGLDPVQKLATRAGISSRLYNFPKTFLGSSEMTLAELALAYTTFPNLGDRPKNLYLIERITDAAGKVVYENRQEERIRVTSSEAAYQVHSALQDVLRTGTGENATTILGPKLRMMGGKTGTSYNFFDAYFIGYTSSVTCAVWVGFDQRQKIFSGAFGNILALPIGATLLYKSLQQGFPAQEWRKPEGLQAVKICKTSGFLATPDCFKEIIDPLTHREERISDVYTEYATSAEVPKSSCNVHGQGVQQQNFVKQIQPSKWPRAQAVEDTSHVQPVAVKSPTLLGVTDVYHSVRPASDRIDLENIPIQKALPLDDEVVVRSTQQQQGQRLLSSPSNDNQVQNGESELPIKRAEAVNPDALFDVPALVVPDPAPATF